MKPFFYFLLVSFCCVTAQANDAPLLLAGEYTLVKKHVGSRSYNHFLDNISAPIVSIDRVCSKQTICWPIIQNEEGEVLKRFSRNTTLSAKAQGRYTDRAYLYFSESYRSGGTTQVRYYVMDNEGRTRQFDNEVSGSLATTVNLEGQVVAVSPSGIYLDGQIEQQTIPAGLKYAEFGANPEGQLALVGVDTVGFIHLSDLQNWLATDEQLSRKGDRKGVLSIYPAGNQLHFAAYKYVNSYNKGLVYGRADLTSEKTVSGWLFNSELENIGFDPSIYQVKDQLLISAVNSSKSESAYFMLPLALNEDELTETTPMHTVGFEDEKTLELMLGTGVASLFWTANADVEQDSTTYASTDYDLSNSLYKNVWLQGKLGNKQLAIIYGQNEAEEKGGQTKQVSRMFNAVLDFNGLFSPQSSLRLKVAQSSLGGVANLSVKDVLGVTQLTSAQNVTFTTRFDQYSALVLGERGRYWGLVYEAYRMPGMLGFSDSSKQIRYVGYDPETKLSKYGLVYGYDELDYVRRYENDYSQFYFDWLVGIGYVDVDVSNQLKAELRDEGKKLTSSGALGLDGKLDLGYVHQRKFKKWRGVGYSLTTGYRLKAGYMGAGQSDNSKNTLKPDEVAIEFSRLDIWHGLYANLSLVF